MIVVLDTNVVISRIFWSGLPHQILKLWSAKKFQLAVSLEIIYEYRRVGQEIGKKYPHINIENIIDLIVSNSANYTVEAPRNQICRDPDDDKFIVCGLAAKAKYIVSGDKALLDLDEYSGIKILKPNQFLNVNL